VKLLDFGVSKFVGAGLHSMTREGLALGTFSYMPPEQMMGAKRVDVRADIYSLGVVLYQCLVGTPPFVAKSIPALSNLMAQNEYIRVSRVRPDVPAELDAILERSLRADPSERYAGVREFREDLVRLSRRSLPSRTLSVGEMLPPSTRSPAPRSPAQSDRPRPSAPMTGSPLHRSSPVSKASIIETVVPRTRRKS
jgi:serine/threonine-protein kinase